MGTTLKRNIHKLIFIQREEFKVVKSETGPLQARALRNDIQSSDFVILGLFFVARGKQNSDQLNNIDFLLVEERTSL